MTTLKEMLLIMRAELRGNKSMAKYLTGVGKLVLKLEREGKSPASISETEE